MAKQPKRELTLREHLNELRRRLFIAALAVMGGTAVAFTFQHQVLEFLMEPARAAMSTTEGSRFIFTDLAETLGITMKVSLLGGLILATPVVAYQLVMFVSPGLTPRERRYVFLLLPGITAAFAGGVAFGYFVLIPPALRFLLTFNSDLATPMIRVGSYVSMIVTLLFWIGVVFETPVFMFTLARLGVASYRTFARWRRPAFVLAFVLGAIITPTFDPINQGLVALPIIALYELGIWLAWLGQRRKKAPTADASGA